MTFTGPTILILILLLSVSTIHAEPVDQRTSNAGLPDPFMFSDGTRVSSKNDWTRRRAELQDLILRYEYGQMPPAPGNTQSVELQRNARDHHNQYKITCGPDQKISLVLDLLLPEGKGPFPVILRGDLCWGSVPDDLIKQITGRGYILAQFNRLEMAPDLGSETTLLRAAYPEKQFGAIAAWAWGFHRCVDVLTTLDFVDKTKIAITGHSRGGKAALLAGATDERIALTVPNGSGTGGADCYRVQGRQSEGIARITKNFPLWLAPDFKQFAGNEDRLPFDQHDVLALCAPRALLMTDALDDQYANPHGSFQTFHGAREVYKFLGVPDKIALHYRDGKHAQNEVDWKALLDYADQVFAGKPSQQNLNPKPFDDQLLFKWTAPESK